MVLWEIDRLPSITKNKLIIDWCIGMNYDLDIEEEQSDESYKNFGS